MTKPEITPIVSNRDVASPFLTSIQENAVKPIEPVFLDFKKDMSQLTAKSDIPVLYKQNTTNDLFQLIYRHVHDLVIQRRCIILIGYRKFPL